jgi:predicted O-methyltransferase YrrM
MPEFYKKIPGEQMFDFENYYSEVAEAVLPDPCRIAEIGNADGRSAIFLAEKLKELGIEFKLYMIDNCAYGGDEQFKTLVKNVYESGLHESIELIRADSLVAACKFEDGFFDFVFIDSSHRYEETKSEILIWYRKVKELGVLAGHDYLSEENPEVRKAVDELIDLPTLEQTTLGNTVWYIQKNKDSNKIKYHGWTSDGAIW